MYRKILICLLLALSFSLTASATDWSELIGKQLVLYRWGKMQDRCFSDYYPTNTMGKEPIERIILSDATHVEWNYSQQGSFARECSIEGSVLTFKESIFGNKHLRILEVNGEVVLTLGEDSLTRAFFIMNPNPAHSQLPASVNSAKGFCNGKLDKLQPYFTDLTYSSRTPMGRHFLYHKQVSQEEKAWLESTKEVFDNSNVQIGAYNVNLYPHEIPVQADVHKNGVVLTNAGLVLKDMAILYPEFIKSIIHQEAADSFRVDMFAPDGKPITVCVSNRFVQEGNTTQIFSIGEDGCYNWISILEKAIFKWIQVYGGRVEIMANYCSEMITPMFTGDGRSFCIQPDRLGEKNLSRIINTCLENGMMVNAVTDSYFLSLLSDKAIIHPLMGIRIISPGAAAKYFDKNAVKNISVAKIAKAAGLFPSNWRNTQTGDWEIGFFDDFAIYDCQFWNYKQKQQKGDKYSFVLENNSKEVTVNIGNLKKDIRTIEIAGKKANYDVVNTKTLPDYPTKDTRTGFVDNGYKMDTVTLVGWFKDMPESYRQSMPFKFNYGNFFTEEEQDFSAEYDEKGRFSIKIPVLNSSEFFCYGLSNAIRMPFEAGKTYFLYYDFKSGSQYFMGDDCRLQNEILTYPVEWISNRMEEGGNFDRYITSVDSLLKTQYAAIDELCKAHPTLSARFLQYKKNNILSQQAEDFGQARFRTSENRFPENASKYAYDTFWTKMDKPYTLYRDLIFFLRDYLYDSIRIKASSWNYFDHLESLGLDDKELAVVNQWKSRITELKEAVDKATTTEEKTRIAQEFNTKNAESFKSVSKILNGPKAARVIRGNLFISEMTGSIQPLDSLGADSFIKDMYLFRLAYKQIDWGRCSLLPEALDTLRALTTNPIGLELVEKKSATYLAIENRDFDRKVLKSNDNLENITEGEALLKKIIEPYKGKIILLDVWGTWCSPCKEMLSHSTEEYARLKDFDMIFLYLANNSPQNSWENVIKQYNVVGDNVVHYNLPADQQSAIEKFLNVHAFPTYKLIDREGNVLDVNADPYNLEDLARLLQQMK